MVVGSVADRRSADRNRSRAAPPRPADLASRRCPVEPRQDAIDPGAARPHGDVHLVVADDGRLDAKTVRLRGGHGADARTDDVAPGLSLPGELEQLALGEVGDRS